MKKRLLFAFAVMLTAMTAFAQEYVYTPQGKFNVTGENLCSNSDWKDGNFEGWTVVSANAEATCKDKFSYVEGEGIQSLDAAKGEGMYYAAKGLNPDKKYVVSITFCQTDITVPNEATRTYVDGGMATNTNYVQISGNSDKVYGGTADAVTFGKASEIVPGDPITYSYAIVGDGTDRDYFIEFLGMNPAIKIQSVEIREAEQVGNDLDYKQLYDYAKIVRGAYAWKESEILEGLDEMLEIAEAYMLEPPTVDEMEEFVGGFKEVVNTFLKENMDDYLPTAIDKLPKAASKVSKQSKIGIWSDFGATSRIHSSAGDYYDLGHFQNGNTWGNGAGNIGLQTTMELVPGVYVFSVSLRAQTRENVKSTWTNNDGLQFAQGELYVKQVVDGAVQAEKYATTDLYPLLPADFVKNTLVFTVTETGNYQISMNTTANEAYAGIKTGSVAYPFEASLWAKTTAKYTKAQELYLSAVKTQITTGRDNITAALASYTDETKSWGKAALAEAINAAEEALVDYEAMSDDEIVATFDEEVYDSSKGLESLTQDGADNPTGTYEDYNRLLEAKVYVDAVKGIIAANNAFKSQNDKIESLTTAIANAQNVLDARLYTYATGKDALKAAIDAAAATEETLRAGDYSEEAAAEVDAAIAALNDAVAEFKTTLPAEKIQTIVDIDFSNDAVLDEETGIYSIKGAAGEMALPSYTPALDANNTDYQLGYNANAEVVYGDVLRVGNGEATVGLAGWPAGSILNVSFDMYFGNLITCYAGYYIKNVNDENLAALYMSKYDGKSYSENDPAHNTFGCSVNDHFTGAGSSSGANDVIAAESNKTHFEIVMDLGDWNMSCTTSGDKGTFASQLVQMNPEVDRIPAKFVLKSNYSNADRRCWFDNLKVVAVDAGITGVAEIDSAEVEAAQGVVKFVKGNQVVIKTANGTINAVGQAIQ